MAPWADALFAMDVDWWTRHQIEVQATFEGQSFCSNRLPAGFRVTYLHEFKSYLNSGAGAINLAVKSGAARVLMLGYDCQKTDGRAHWHGDHPKGLGNAGSIDRWPKKFAKLAADCKGVDIINCSRATALDVFPRMELEEALEQIAA